jgi:hypothetical protein
VTSRALRRTGALVALTLLLASCAAASNDLAGAGTDLPGFWLGLWHGLISPVTFIVSLFRDDVGIYAVRNSGGWYDFGFLFGASVVFSSVGRTGSNAVPRRARPPVRGSSRGTSRGASGGH